MNFFDILLWPFKWVIEAILVFAHELLSLIGLNPISGISWVIAIAVLVIIVRAAMIPLFLHQVRNGKKMAAIAPKIKELQKKYEGKTDTFSRQKQSEEMVALYKEAGTNPLSFLTSTIIQAPILISLYAVLNHAARTGEAGVGLLTANLATQFNAATFFGASLHGSFLTAVTAGTTATLIIAPAIIIIMIAAQYLTLRWGAKVSELTAAEPTPKDSKKNLGMRIQYGALAFFSIIFIFTGAAFPLSLLVYILFSTLWTAVQQYIYLKVEQKAVTAQTAEAE